MNNAQQDDQRFQKLQQQAKELGVGVVEMLLTMSELWCAISLNDPRRALKQAT